MDFEFDLRKQKEFKQKNKIENCFVLDWLPTRISTGMSLQNKT